MVDVCRHFHNATTIKKVLANMARYKLNVFHFHLTDDQGWRIESKRFPNLTTAGSIRDSSPMPWDREKSDGTPYGPYFFTQAEVRDIIAYARAREITVVPEFEMPGHSLAALTGYPQYSCTGGPFRPLTKWGVQPDIFCAGNDATLAFLEELLDEMLTIFDSEYIHTGGDEAPHDRWAVCPKCRARMAALGLKTTDELQSWFTTHFAKYLSDRGRRLIGWDEILQGGLPDGTAVMSWRGTDGGVEAAKLGHEVVMTPTGYLYFDYRQFGGKDQYEYFNGIATIHNLYGYDPTAGIDNEYKKFVIGVQGNLWTEYIWGQDSLEWKIWPRAAALAEIAWTPAKDWGRFLAGIVQVEAARLATLGVHAAGIASGVAATWERGEIPTRWVTMQWPVNEAVDQVGGYQIAFVYTSGKNDLHINNVRLYVNGLLAGSDEHEGVAGLNPARNIYSVKSTLPALEGKVWVNANVSCAGGSDSGGSIFVYYI
jgi:hexosaminidase